MAWPFQKKTEEPTVEPTKVNDPEKKTEPTKSNEKSVAEMIAESLKPITEGFATLRQDIESLKVKPKPVSTTPAERISVLDDEDAAFNQRMTPILQSQLELEARYNRDAVKSEYIDAGFGDFWRENAARINEKLEASPLVQQGENGFIKLRGDLQYIRNVVNMFIGEAARQSGMKFDAGKKTFFLESANGEGGGSGAPKDTDGLTPQQIKAAQKWGIPLDKYKTSQSKLQQVS